MDRATERDFQLNLSANLDHISTAAPHTQGVMVPATEYCWKIFKRHIDGKKILELGPAEGVMTKLMLNDGLDVTVVEGSKVAAQKLVAQFSQIEVFSELFEDFETSDEFDAVILGHVLEHVDDPEQLLVRCKRWLKKPNGKVMASVPNAGSLHRTIAVEMGLLSHSSELNPSDIAHGHQRVFHRDEFSKLFLDCDYSIVGQGGYWLKSLSNSQIENWYSAEMINASMAVGEEYPEIAGEIYIIAN